MSSTDRLEAERAIQRNPHPDFKGVEASRPPFNTSSSFHYTKTPSTSWKPGDGANIPPPNSVAHREIDPYEEGRPAVFNYKLLISGVVPRPVGFISTVSGDGKSTNLAPFSYFNFVNHDPPIFVVGFAGSLANAKDTLRNLLDTKEAVVNIISEEFVEAANFTSINAPEGISEWPLSGLTPAKSKIVKPDRVAEAVFSTEATLVEVREWESKATPGKKTGVTAFLEGVRFWVREDAINAEGNIIDPKVLKPISRLGGITFARTTEAFELPRPVFDEMLKDPEAAKLAKPKADEQE
ncbi:flavo protein-like protein oxygenase [Aaosphaeria arxii CBS 175.79]|uniref:Flavo protein-like protein oxygenase n=1 Tax=Aaosphaeria arxii CBS 175.79 TaxID=1450172 RepID=A0A6A5XE39_9PLEO|nr:flavo protein-like protein oxygenase [Aaosphaeria arxii CBS 175.79]KAF2011160.1 flavo protein-like protein oxygenase [Aaosphaeria arxii CBS 175.79]